MVTGLCPVQPKAAPHGDSPAIRFQYHLTVATKKTAKHKLQLLHSEKLRQLPWLVHAFSTRHGGVSRVYGGNALNLGFTKQDSRASVERNRTLFLKQLGVPNP